MNDKKPENISNNGTGKEPRYSSNSKDAKPHGTSSDCYLPDAPKPVPSSTSAQIDRIKTERWALHEHIDHSVEPVVELIKESCHGPQRPAGPLEKQISWVVHTAAQIVISYQPFLSANGLEFNAVRASGRAAALLFDALEQFAERYPEYKLEIKVGEKQRYGVPGYVITGVTFGIGQITIEIAADVIEASRNIYRHYPANKSNLGPIIAMGASGSFVGFDDMFYINGRVASPWLDKTKVKTDPRLPPGEFVASLAAAANLPIEEIKVLILCRDRNFDADGRGTIQQLIDAGISVVTRDHEEMRKRVAAEQIYANGNLYLTNNDFFPRTGLITEKLHGIILTGRPTEGELLIMINHILGGQGMAEIISYDSLTDGVKDIMFTRDKKKWSDYEKGRWRLLKASGHSSAKFQDEVWTPSRPNDMGIAVGFSKSSFWDQDIKGVTVDTERSTVSCDVFWMGTSGEYKIFRITYPIRLPNRRSQIHAISKGQAKTATLLKWAEAAMHFRQFKTAVWAVQKAYEQATGPVELERCKGTMKQAVAFAALVSRKTASRALQTAVTALSVGSGALYRESPATRRLLRRLLHTQADTFRREGRASFDRHYRIIDEDANKNLVAAIQFYQTVLFHFEKDIGGSDDQFKDYYNSLDTRNVRFEAQQDRLEFNTAQWQLKVVTFLNQIVLYRRGLPVALDIQGIFADLADCYEQLARVRESIAHKSAIKYKERMLQVLDDISRTFGNMLPRDKVLLAARSYMQESMWEPALKTFARMIDPQKAFRIFSPKFDDPAMRSDFYESIYIDLYLVPVLAKYLHCRMLLLKKPKRDIKAVLQKTKRWLIEFETVMVNWAQKEMLTSTEDGVVLVEGDSGGGRKMIELLDFVSEYRPEDRNQ